MADSIAPVYIKARDLPFTEEKDKPYTVRELCGAAERVAGHGSIEGAQQIGGVWRIYPLRKEAKVKILTEGVTVRGTVVTPSSVNPFNITDGGSAGEINTTRVVIGNIPINCPTTTIEETIVALGIKLVSRVIEERDRDHEGKLTRWKTGRRFVYIEIPKDPLPKQIKIGIYRASIYHKEQKKEERKKYDKCFNCFAIGHHAGECPKPQKCRACRQEGHKAGDSTCTEMAPVSRKSVPDKQQVVNKPDNQQDTSRGRSPNKSPCNKRAESADSGIRGQRRRLSDDSQSSTSPPPEPACKRGKGNKESKENNEEGEMEAVHTGD